MASGRSWRKVGLWLAGAAGVVVGLVLLVRVGLGIYLGTSHGRASVARELESLIGLPVEVSEAEFGSNSSSVKFRVLDPALAGHPDAEVLSVESATADVSVTDIMTGRANPKEVHLRGVHLNLRIGADGKILTTLPAQTGGAGGGGPPPTITLDGGEVRLRQEGKPEFVLSGIRLRMAPDGDRLVVSGSVDDPGWGKWKVTGEIDRPGKTGWLELATDDGPLATERLRSVPYVPGSIWDHVRLDGRGGVKVRLTYAPDGDVRYDVEVRPHGAAIELPDAESTLTDLTGAIRVHDAQVELAGCKAKVAGGTIGATGVADFGADPTTVKVAVTADKLDVNAVPPSWDVPRDFGGRLVGAATIVLRISRDGHIDPTGTKGNGKIEGATIRGFPAEIELHLRPVAGQLKLSQGSPPPGQPQSQSPAPGAAPPDRRAGPEFGCEQGRGEQPDPVFPVLLVLLEHPDAEVSLGPPRPRSGPAVPALERGLGRFQALAGQPPKQPDPKGPPPSSTALEATVTLRDVDVGEFLAKMEVKIPTRVSGKVAAKVAISVPVERAGAVAAYQFKGTLTSPALTVEGLTIRDFEAQIDFHNGRLTLSTLRGSIAQPGEPKAAPGTFSGTASAQIDPPGDIKASFRFDNLPPGEVLKAIPNWSLEVRGVASGKAEFAAPYNAVNDPSTWTASASLSSNELVVAGRPVTGIKFAATVAKGTVTVTDAAATIAGIPATATGTLGLTGKYPFDVEVRTRPTDVTDLRKLVPDVQLGAVEGLLEVDAKVTGTASPVAFNASGTVRASKLTLAHSQANHVEVKWEANQDRLVVSSLAADLFGGKVTGSAEYPFDPQKAGKFAVAFDQVDAAAASALVPDFPVKLTGRVSGKVNGVIAPEKPGESRIGDLEVSLTSDRLTVQGLPADSLEGSATIKGGVITFALKGKTLGGDFDIKGSYPGQGKQPPPKGERGVVNLRNLDLSRIARDLKYPAAAPLHGRLNLTFEFEPDLSAGSGRVEIFDFGWGITATARYLRGVLVLRDGVLTLTELTGPFAGGTLSVGGRVSVRRPMRNFFAIEFHRVNVGQLLGQFPEVAGVVQGELSAVIRGTYQQELRLDGTGTLHRGSLGGIAVEELRVPFRLTTSSGGQTELSVHEASTRAGSGQLRGEATLVWGSTLNVDAHVRFEGVPIATVIPSLGTNALISSGRITGRFDLSGSSVQSANDLNGILIASLQGASPAQIPLLQQAVPYLNPLGLVRPFDSGDVRAHLSRGVFRVQRLTLVSPSAQVFAEGTVTLSGRVDLFVVAHTGQIGPDVRALRLFGLRLPAIGPIPIGLISDVSAFLSNRTIRVEITGTVDAPVVRVNARALLAEEAVRFFLTRYVLPPEAVDVFGAGTGLVGGSMQRK
jgi:hypothetical protein